MKYMYSLCWIHGRGGVRTSSGEFVKTVASFSPETLYDFDVSKVRRGKSAIFIGCFWGYVWGHCFTDHFEKLWALRDPLYRELVSTGSEIIYIANKDHAMPSYFRELLRLAGLDISRARCINEVEYFEELYVPDTSFAVAAGGRPSFYHKEYADTIAFVKESVRKEMQGRDFPVFSKIYLTRTHGTFTMAWRDFGEKRIEKAFESKGYKVIAPESFSVAEQIWLMMNCKFLAATEGSVAHNSVFCNAGTEVALLKKCDNMLPHQLVINKVSDLDVTYIDIHKSDKVFIKYYLGPFYMYVNKNLKQYLGLNCIVIPPKLDYLFWWYNITYWIRRMYTVLSKIKGVQKIAHKIIYRS